jgi:hypothetical protein
MAAPIFLDLSKAANYGPNQNLEGSSQGVEDPKEKEGFANIPQGPQTFRGIPFQLLDWTQNQGRSYIVLKGRRKQDLPDAVALPAGGEKADSLYFLHTCRWGGTDAKTTIAEYEVIYADGKVALVPLHVGAEITNFTGADDTPASSLAWWHKYKNTDMGLSLFHWKNPRPEEPIQSIVFRSMGKMPVPLLFAVTLSDKELVVSPVSPKPEKTFQTDTKDWNSYLPPSEPVTGKALDMGSLLDAPAGKHGKVKADGDHLVFEDGTPARFWGCRLDLSQVEKGGEGTIAENLASIGCNLVELEGPESPGGSAALLEALKAKGIYVLASPSAPGTQSSNSDPGSVDLPIKLNGEVGMAPGQDPVTFNDAALVLSPENSPWVNELFKRGLGQPWGFSWTGDWPNEYHAGTPLMACSFGTFEGASVVMGTELSTSPILRAQFGTAALAYLRGDLKEGHLKVIEPGSAPLPALIHRSGIQPEGGHFKTDPSGILKGKVQEKTRSLVSDTEQIRWQGNVGVFQVSSPRFQAIAGFVGQRKLNSPVWQVESQNHFASFSEISMTNSNLWTSTHILLSAATRMENTGQIYNAAKTKLIERGRAPILLEPVQAKVILFRYQKDPALKVRALGWDGQPLKTRVPMKWAKTNLVLQWPSDVYFLEVVK